jgi:cell fate (sporulation/competence/biofilm development) regulator YlbF (YheA/YmcA/DUF963 family)
VGGSIGAYSSHFFQSRRDKKQYERQLQISTRDRIQPQANELQRGLQAIRTLLVYAVADFGQPPDEMRQIFQECNAQLSAALEANDRLGLDPGAEEIHMAFTETIEALRQFQSDRQLKQESASDITYKQLGEERKAVLDRTKECETAMKRFFTKINTPI